MTSNIIRELRNDDEILQYLQEEIQMKGRQNELLLQKGVYRLVSEDKFVKCNILHLSLKQGRSKAVLFKLIEIGGRELVMQKDGNGNSALQIVFKNDSYVQVPNEVVSKLIEIGGRELVMMRDDIGDTALHSACTMRKGVPIQVLSKLLEIGGPEIVMVRDDDGDTALHYACVSQASIEVISKIIDIGGFDLVMAKNKCGNTALHYTCTTLFSAEVVFKLIEAGGEDLVVEKDKNEYTALHKVFIHNDGNHDANGTISTKVVSKLVEIGGRNYVIEKNYHGDTALHLACRHNFSTALVSKLIDIGGQELVLETNHFGNTPLHDACKNQPSNFDVISQLIEIGGRAIVREKNNNGLHALHYFYTHQDDEYHITTFDEDFLLIVREGITAQIGGEFGIGGLFNVVQNDDVQREIYEKWQNFAPSLEIVMKTLHPPPPLLHAALIAGAPQHIILDITNRFNCVLIKDSMNRYPIDLAVAQGFEWNKGMQELLEATAAAQKRSSVFTAAHHGLKWINHMDEEVELHLSELEDRVDDLTGLRLFMLAAMGNASDLSSVYGIMKRSPETTTYVNRKKRKRRINL